MTRVALVCDYSLDYLGGAQSAFLDQASVLAQQGHEVTVIAPGARAPEDGAYRVRAIDARRTLPVADLPLLRNTRGLREVLAAELTAGAIEIVHVHSEFGLTAAAMDAAATLHIPVVQTVHTFFWQAQANRLLSGVGFVAAHVFARWLRRYPASTAKLADSALDSALRGVTLSAAQRAQVVVSPSAHQAARLREAGLDEVVVIENPAPRGSEGAAPLTRVELPLRVAWIGRLTPEKRILEFVEAVQRAHAELGPGRLRAEVIGDGPLLTRVREAVAESTADIRLRGRLSREEVHAHVRGAHLVALTSYGFDNQPVVVVEALNEARTVLYVDDNLVEGLAACGILADSPDAAGIAAALVTLAENPDLVVQRSHDALEAAEQFSPRRHAELVGSAYARAQEIVAELSAR